VVGPQFLYLHELFRDQYRDLDTQVDALGERIRGLGGVVPGRLTDLLQYARAPERPACQPPARDMVAHLSADHQALADVLTQTLADETIDAVSRAVLAQLLACHERQIRLLRAFIEAPVDAPG
jgi:DNA-binding ferritin-like protein